MIKPAQSIILNSILVLVSTLIFIMPVTAQSVSISGHATDRPNQLVRVIVYADQFSHLEKTIATTQTDEQGAFNISFDYSEINYALLAINLDKGEFYLKPGASYYFEVYPDTSSRQKSYFDKQPLSFDLKADDEQLNESIERFNTMFNTFVLQEFNSIYKSRSLKAVRDFEAYVTNEFGDHQMTYFEDYINYKIASIKWLSKKRSSQQIIQNYYQNKPLLFNNIEYTGFFNELFENYPSNYTHLMPYSELVMAVNDKNSYANFDAILARDSLLSDNQQLRELVAMLSLSRYYYVNDFRRDQVVKVIRQLERNSPFTENRLVAANFLEKLSRNSYGNPATPFELADAQGYNRSLEQYKGKFVLLNFVRTDCKLCFEYLPLLNEMKENQHGKLQVLTLAVDDADQRFNTYNRNRNFDWPVLQVDGQILLLESYDIRTYPSFVIVNPDGSIAMSPAPMPEENLEFFLNRFIQKYENEHQ